MKYISTWSAKPGLLREAAERFLAGEAQPPKGVTLLGRWHSVDCSGGFTLSESKNPAAIYEYAAAWSELLDIHIEPVIEDAEAGPILAKVFKQK
jgi:hypothetical protein